MTDFYRNVHCVMGLPIDAMPMHEALRHLQNARITRTKCFFSTPNLNFTVASRTQAGFRESVCLSDLSLPDGMPLVWVARLLGIPIHERVSGSDLFECLRRQTDALWRVFFFGGQKGIGQNACLAIGDQQAGVRPTGYIYPGFVSNDEMSRDDLIENINESGSDMVVVSLGAAKGQDWICRNRARIAAPVVGHLGAVINFVAGNVQRAPRWMQKAGLEWIWRAKEESVLIRRYLNDGSTFLRLLATRVLPLALYQASRKPRPSDLARADLDHLVEGGVHQVSLAGAWTADNLMPVRQLFTRLEQRPAAVVLDLQHLSHMDSALVALLLLLDQSQRSQGLSLQLVQTPAAIRRYLKWSGVEHLSIQ